MRKRDEKRSVVHCDILMTFILVGVFLIHQHSTLCNLSGSIPHKKKTKTLHTHDLLGVLEQKLLCKARLVINLENVISCCFLFSTNKQGLEDN